MLSPLFHPPVSTRMGGGARLWSSSRFDSKRQLPLGVPAPDQLGRAATLLGLPARSRSVRSERRNEVHHRKELEIMPFSRESIDIEITQDIIDEAIAHSSSHCMIAEALKITIPDARFVSVDLQTIRWSKGNKRYIVLTPRNAQLALLDFDAGKEMKPSRIRLNLRNAQIRSAEPPDKTPEAQEKRREDARRRAETRKVNSRISQKRFVSTGGSSVPGTADGPAPPLGPLAHPKARVGMRRAFGLKQLGQ